MTNMTINIPPFLLSQRTFVALSLFCLVFFALFLTFLILYIQEKNQTINKLLKRPDNNKNIEYVTPILEGGLGNQLFEIAAAYAYAQKTQKKFIINQEIKEVSVKSNTPRPTYFSNIFQWTQHDNTKNYHWIEWKEPHFHYAEIPDLHGNIQLKGYFQSAKYFQEYRKDLIQKIFQPKLLSDFSLPFLETHPSVSIHIRRTDYVGNDLIPVQPITYYQKAIQYLQQHIGPALHLFIFSDDIPWCKNNFNQILIEHQNETKLYFIGDQNEKLKDYQELLLMSTCQHHIIANSSFSWWGAYLDPKPNPTIIAPKKWFNHTHNWQDIYCPDWIVV
jgi:hypothetical protein